MKTLSEEINYELFNQYPALDPAYRTLIRLDKVDGMHLTRPAETLVNAFYAMKHPTQADTLLCVSPRKAKALDEAMVNCPDNWSEERLRLMEILTYEKFKRNHECMWQLLDTYPQDIYAGYASWEYSRMECFGKFWGYPGENKLGEILMKIRSRILKEMPRVPFGHAQAITGGAGGIIEIRYLGQKHPVKYANCTPADGDVITIDKVAYPSVHTATAPDGVSVLDNEKTMVLQIEPVVRGDENPYAFDDGEDPQRFICHRFICMP